MKPQANNEKIEMLSRFVQNTKAHIFLTGKAGTGKTTFLHNLASITNKRMIIVAPTGVAAVNAGGVTIHSFFQLPFGPICPEADDKVDDNRNHISDSLRSNSYKLSKTKMNIIRSLDLLVIDEISMVRADMLDAVDFVLRKVRHSTVPFGGVQLLMIGDIHQLAPVAKQNEWALLNKYYKSVYFFDCLALKKTSYICVELDHIYRQNDNDFINILNQVRNNTIDDANLKLLNSRYNPQFVPNDDDNYIVLTTHNYQADEINENKLASLKTEKITYKAVIKGIFPENAYPTKEELELKVGAQVMFVKNDPSPEKMFYNGKIGKILSLDDDVVSVQCADEVIDVKALTWQNFEYNLNEKTDEIEEVEIGSYTQIPLKTAWAITIHKSQGLTFDKLILNAELAFAHGQVYVALSRCTALKGLVLKSKISRNVIFNDNAINSYLDVIPSLIPDNKRLVKEEMEFLHHSVVDLFSFIEIEIQLKKLAKILRENNNIFEKEDIDKVNDIMNSFKHDIAAVSVKFVRQLDGIFDNKIDIIDQQYLQDRIKKASPYFFDKLNALENITDYVKETDNKAVNTSVKSILKQLKEDLYVKTACLDISKDGFYVEKYLEMKNKKTIESGKMSFVKLKTKTLDSEDDVLLTALKQWRKEKAYELDTEDSKIIPTTALYRIAELKPMTIKELKEISKIGTTRVKKFGADIVNLVLDYKGFKPDDFEDESSMRELLLSSSCKSTLELLDEDYSISDIARERGLSTQTIENHVVEIVLNGFYDIEQFVSDEHVAVIKEYFIETADSSLSAAKDVLGEEFSYFEIKMVLAIMKKELQT